MKKFEIPDDCGWPNVNGYNVGCENTVYNSKVFCLNYTQEWESKKFKTCQSLERNPQEI